MSTQGPLRYSHSIGKFDIFGGNGFYNPLDIAFVGDTIYVVSRGGSASAEGNTTTRVTMCTLEGNYVGEFSGTGAREGLLAWPVSIASDGEGNVYISDEAIHGISVFSKNGEFLTRWGAQGSGDGEFDRPAGIAFDSSGNLLVVDSGNNRVQKYTKEGKYLTAWGRAGAGDGQFNLPWGLSIDASENVYVADWRNDRIQKFDASGNHLATWGKPGRGEGEFTRPAWATADDGLVYISDWGNERLQVLGADGTFKANYRGESGVSRWGQDYLDTNVDEYEARKRSDLEPDLDLLPDDYLRDESAAIEKLFWGPTSVKLDSAGRVYVVDSCRHRIQVYQKPG